MCVKAILLPESVNIPIDKELLPTVAMLFIGMFLAQYDRDK
ncbi:MAG: hypothetical protein ACI9U5_000901 [Colwellia sp.]|jgi:hypothetical protein